MDEPRAKIRRAVALRYEGDESRAPEVVAKGAGEVADRILAVAREHGLPIEEDPDLVELLAVTDVGEEIPVEVYGVVARLLAYLYRLNGELAEGR